MLFGIALFACLCIGMFTAGALHEAGVKGFKDEGDFGISYARADELLNWMLSGYSAADLVAQGFDRNEVALVAKRVESTHWKRRLPTVAMVSPTAINESYLRPVDY